MHTIFLYSLSLSLILLIAQACATSNERVVSDTIGSPTSAVYGGARQDLEDCGDYVHCRVIGQGTILGGVSGMKEVFKYADANNRKLILLDICEADVSELSLPDIIVGTFGLLPFWDFSTRIAVLMPEETLPTLVDRHSFPMGKIRLIKLRRFDSIHDAKFWLLEDEQKNPI